VASIVTEVPLVIVLSVVDVISILLGILLLLVVLLCWYPRKVYLITQPAHALTIGDPVVGPDVLELLSIIVKIERPSGEIARSLKRLTLLK
jgi:hypothetical protein